MTLISHLRFLITGAIHPYMGGIVIADAQR